MKFTEPQMTIEYLRYLDVVLEVSTNNDDSSRTTSIGSETDYGDSDFGF